MLAVVDRSVLVAVPLLVLSVAVAAPDLAVMWALIGLATMGIVGWLARLGKRGRGSWRGAVYAYVTLVVGNGALWTMGPVTGAGVMLGLSTLFAGAFLPRRLLLVTVAVELAALGVRVAVGGEGELPVDLELWIGTALASALMLWIAMRMMTTLHASLEQSYVRAAEAYRLETEEREQLDSSRQQLEELAQVEMVGRLAGGVAHDVNNALAAVLAAADVLASEVSTPEQRRDLAELEAASHHAADLVRDLLWTGRRFPTSTSAVAELGAVIRVCLERVSRVARKVAVEVRVDHALRLALSPEHLEQILFGLIVGAGRSGASQLVLTSRRDGDAVELALTGAADQALPAERPRAMQVQLSASAARELVGQCGGTLTLAQDGELAISLRLPVAPGQPSERPAQRAPTRTALVVEDEPMVLRRLCQLVARRGYEVSAASTVADGLARLAEGPDLLVTDLQLPDGSGEEIALASYEQDPARPIVVCSGFSAEDVRRGRLRHAPLVFLTKPFTSADFEAALTGRHAAGAQRFG